MKIGIIDVETTGVDYVKDKVTEVGFAIFDYETKIPIWVYSSLNDPKQDIPADIVALNKITNKMCKGEKIDWDLVEKKAGECTYIIAHYAVFDMAFVISTTGKTGGFAPGKWLCSWMLIDWSKIPDVRKSFRQSHIGADLGIFNNFPHRALFDAVTLGRIIFETAGLFDEMRKKARCDWYLFGATGSSYHKKDLLKANGYRAHYIVNKYKVSNPDLESDQEFVEKEDRNFGFWCKVVPNLGDNIINENHFLLEEVYPNTPAPKDLMESLQGVDLPYRVVKYEHWYQPVLALNTGGNADTIFPSKGKKENGK